jgi:hypothetical protein
MDPSCKHVKVGQPLIGNGPDLTIAADVTGFKPQHPVAVGHLSFLFSPLHEPVQLAKHIARQLLGLYVSFGQCVSFGQQQ